MMKFDLYECQSIATYFDKIRRQFAHGNRKMSLVKFAKRYGYSSHRTVGMILKGERLPSPEMLQKISRRNRHNDREFRYLQLILEREQLQRKELNTLEVNQELLTLVPKRGTKFVIDLDKFSYLADWYHFVVKQLLTTPGFEEDYELIAKRLGKKVTPATVRKAVQTMINLGVIARDQKGNLTAVAQGIDTQSDIKNDALQSHHRQMLERATEALEEPVLEREFQALALKFNRKNLPQAKQDIRRFMDEFDQKYCVEDGKDVFQLNVQLFSHTKPTKGEALC